MKVCCQLTWFVTDALRLTPLPDPVSAAIPLLAKSPVWQFLDEERCTQEVFDVALVTFDDTWKQCTDHKGLTPTSQTYQLCMATTKCLLQELIETVI